MEKPLDPFTEMKLADASRVLGYRSKGTLLKMFAEGKIPGARKISAQVIAIPAIWVKEQQEIAKDSVPKVGKPRGYIQPKK